VIHAPGLSYRAPAYVPPNPEPTERCAMIATCRCGEKFLGLGSKYVRAGEKATRKRDQHLRAMLSAKVVKEL
jgi:hypothetical protein